MRGVITKEYIRCDCGCEVEEHADIKVWGNKYGTLVYCEPCFEKALAEDEVNWSEDEDAGEAADTYGLVAVKVREWDD